MLTALLLSAAVLQAPAASPSATPDDQEIVVQGTRERDRERQISNFVKSLTEAPVAGQISRFNWEVCPAATGLDDAQAAKVAARMRVVAKAAGIKTAPENCRTNVLLIVAPNKRSMIERLSKAYPAYFSGVTRDEIKRMARSPGPVAAWQIEGMMDADGIRVVTDLLTGNATVERSDSPSRLRRAAKAHFVASVVVVESSALVGLTVTQLADYAAMRGFARTDPARLRPGEASSILSVIEAPMGSFLPATLTEWDYSFLKALYSTTSDYASQQRAEMQNVVREELDNFERRKD